MLIFSSLISECTTGIHPLVYNDYRNQLRDISSYLKRYPPNENPEKSKVYVEMAKKIALHNTNIIRSGRGQQVPFNYKRF